MRWCSTSSCRCCDDRGLRTDRLGLLGWSMGGYAALRLGAVLGPDACACVAAESPALWTDGEDASRSGFRDAREYAEFSVFGHQHALAGIPVRIDCGDHDPFYDATRAYVAGFPKDDRPSAHYQPGAHDMDYWRRMAPAQLRFVARHLDLVASYELVPRTTSSYDVPRSAGGRHQQGLRGAADQPLLVVAPSRRRARRSRRPGWSERPGRPTHPPAGVRRARSARCSGSSTRPGRERPRRPRRSRRRSAAVAGVTSARRGRAAPVDASRRPPARGGSRHPRSTSTRPRRGSPGARRAAGPRGARRPARARAARRTRQPGRRRARSRGTPRPARAPARGPSRR